MKSKYDTYKIFCKLKFLAIALDGLHTLDRAPNADECYGAQLLLDKIAYEVAPEQRDEEKI